MIPIIMDEYLNTGLSEKTIPIPNADIPKHTKEKPIKIERNADETIG